MGPVERGAERRNGGPAGSAALLVAQRRLVSQWRSLAVAGLVLGIGFGLCFASLATARRTDSAYGRILAASEAPDASVALDVATTGLSGPGSSGSEPAVVAGQAEQSLRAIEGVSDVRVFGGFLGSADGVEPISSAALLAPTGDRFPIERPRLQAGRLPDPDAADEVFVNTQTADRNGLEVGQRLHYRLIDVHSGGTVGADVTIVGIGTLPQEAVTDETSVLDVAVFTRAFYEAHQQLAVYTTASVDLAAGFDARRDLAAEVGALGHELQSAITQQQQAVDEALRPLIIVLAALGALTFAVTAVAAGQVAGRRRTRWHADDMRLLTLGMTRSQLLVVEFAIAGITAGLTVVVALVTMLAVSPIGPVGPLHDLDPAPGFDIDWLVAAAGAAAILVLTGLLTLGYSSARRPALRPVDTRPPRVPTASSNPVVLAGFALALRDEDGRYRPWRGVAATVAATATVGVCAAFVSSAVALTATPSRYGFDADLLAVNAYGDQSADALAEAFGARDDVVAATGFTTGSFLVDGYAVPGLAATPVTGAVTPTLLQGVPPRDDDEIVLGQDTLESIAAAVGDVVPVQMFEAATADGELASRPVDMKIVGIATFPPVTQVGTDTARLGIGALVTRDAFVRMGGERTNDPEFTLIRLADGADPAAVVSGNETGFQDASHTTTSWFTDAEPAELRQLDAAMPYLRGTVIVGYLILLAVVAHGLWTRARSNSRARAVLRAVGFTGGQLDGVAALQAVPIALGALLLGIPIGLIAGRRAYERFAESLAVVDVASTPATAVSAMVTAVLLAAGAGGAVAVAVARRTRPAATTSDVVRWRG